MLTYMIMNAQHPTRLTGQARREAIVQAVTSAVMASLEAKKK